MINKKLKRIEVKAVQGKEEDTKGILLYIDKWKVEDSKNLILSLGEDFKISLNVGIIKNALKLKFTFMLRISILVIKVKMPI
jgi:hypothetical protein